MDVAQQLDAINAASASGELETAAAMARTALREGVRHPVLMRLVAEDIERQDGALKAVQYLNRALVLMPGDPTLLIALGARLMKLGRPSEAIRMLAGAIEADPTAVEAHFAMGRALSAQGEMELARRHYERALELEPDYAQARAALALLLARMGETAAAKTHAERTLADVPGHVTGTIALALAEVGARDYVGAEARLLAVLEKPAPTPSERAVAFGVLADALDGQQRTAEAFDAYTRANEAQRQLFAGRCAAGAQALFERIARLTEAFVTEDPARWTPTPLAAGEAPSGAIGHAFLIGFPRSGTTLLEQVLAAHPQVTTLEEKTGLAKAEAAFLNKAGEIDPLATIDAETAARFRYDYWRIVRDFIDPAGRFVIDKMPLTAISLPLVAKLFPEAKILFARRDPRDIVLSCFRRAFMPNPATYSLLTLKGAADLFAGVMGLTDLYREKLPLSVHEVRYERFVAAFEEEARAVCDFLGLEWDAAVMDFAAKAARRTVTTPSAIQVRRGIYRDGEGQWRPYREQLAPVLPILEPWIESQGYPPK